MIRNFLFDIGNVLLKFDLGPALAKLNHREDLSPAEALTRVIHQRDLMEAGALAPDDFVAFLKEELAYPGTLDEARAIYADIFTPNYPVWEVAENLAADGYRLVLFSNISPIHADFIKARYPVFAHFPEAIFSYKTGDIKPRDGMYAEAVEKLGMLPAETFYLDDNAANIATGDRFGFVTHVYDFDDHPSLLHALARAEVAGFLLK
jgi:glucose-1-phosphatase